LAVAGGVLAFELFMLPFVLSPGSVRVAPVPQLVLAVQVAVELAVLAIQALMLARMVAVERLVQAPVSAAPAIGMRTDEVVRARPEGGVAPGSEPVPRGRRRGDRRRGRPARGWRRRVMPGMRARGGEAAEKERTSPHQRQKCTPLHHFASKTGFG